MHRTRNEPVGLGDLVPALDAISRTNDGLGRVPGMLAQRQDDLVGKRHAPDRHARRECLQLRRVHAVSKAGQRVHRPVS
jgi:hypothetical protein